MTTKKYDTALFAKNKINSLIKAWQNGDNYVEDPLTFKLKLLEAKMLTDRWDQLSSDVIFHPSHKKYVNKNLQTKNNTIWGMNIHYSDNCPVNTGILVCLDNSGKLLMQDGKSISVFKF